MAHLHHERWPELAPEFEAKKLIVQAVEILTDAAAEENRDSATISRTLAALREAERVLHPATQNPDACKEYEARKSGTYEAEGVRRQSGRDRDRDSDRDREIERLRKELDEAKRGSAPGKNAGGDSRDRELEQLRNELDEAKRNPGSQQS